MATASQKMILQQKVVLLNASCASKEILHGYSLACLMRFFDVIRGSRCAAPSKLLPVIKMPLMTVVEVRSPVLV